MATEMPHLSLCETLGQTFGLLCGRRKNLSLFLLLSLSLHLPVSLNTLGFLLSYPSLRKLIHNTDADFWNYVTRHGWSLAVYAVEQAVLYTFLLFTAQGAMVRAAAEIYAGHSPRFASCLRHGIGQMGRLFCASCLVWVFLLVTGFLVTGLSAALVHSQLYTLTAALTICYAAVAFCVWMTALLLYPILVVESTSTGPAKALQRAWILSRGLRCQFFAAALCVWGAKAMVLGLLQGAVAQNSLVAGILLASFASLISLPLTTILSTILYMSARARMEDDFTRQVLCDNLGLDVVAPPGHADNDNTNDTPNDTSNQNDDRDERRVPLLADTDALEPDSAAATSAATPHVVDSEQVILVDAKEVPLEDIPEASEVV